MGFRLLNWAETQPPVKALRRIGTKNSQAQRLPQITATVQQVNNELTADTTRAIFPIKIDTSQEHIVVVIFKFYEADVAIFDSNDTDRSQIETFTKSTLLIRLIPPP